MLLTNSINIHDRTILILRMSYVDAEKRMDDASSGRYTHVREGKTKRYVKQWVKGGNHDMSSDLTKRIIHSLCGAGANGMTRKRLSEIMVDVDINTLIDHIREMDKAF